MSIYPTTYNNWYLIGSSFNTVNTANFPYTSNNISINPFTTYINHETPVLSITDDNGCLLMTMSNIGNVSWFGSPNKAAKKLLSSVVSYMNVAFLKKKSLNDVYINALTKSLNDAKNSKSIEEYISKLEQEIEHRNNKQIIETLTE